MSEKKIIAVAGATGSQGGGAARALLADDAFRVRALTRNTESTQAQALAAGGAEVVQADFYDPTSLRAAFDGAYGAFLVTNFWAHGSADKETEEIQNLVNAARNANLQHVVWSTLEDTRDLLPLEDTRMPVLQDRYNVPHFDAKGEGNKLFVEAGVPTTNLNTTFFYQGFLGQMGPKRAKDGSLVLTLPIEEGRLLAGVDVNDIGRTSLEILKNGSEFIGKTVGLAGDHLTGHQYADILGDAIGEIITFQSVPYDVFRRLGFPGAVEIANMFQYYGDFDKEFTEARNINRAREINPGLKDFRTWARENVGRDTTAATPIVDA